MHSIDGVVEWQITELVEVATFIELHCCLVAGQHMKVYGLAVAKLWSGEVRDEAVQQEGT